MSVNWPLTTLKKAGINLIDCDHKTPKAQKEGFPYIGIPQLKDGRILLDGARLISEADFHHWRRKANPAPDDVILSRRCNPGEMAYVPKNLDIALGQNLVLLRADGEKVFPPFLRWVSQGSNWWRQVNKYINVGAVFDSLKCADIPKFEFRLPPMEDQKRIAKILGDLDKKIELNRQTNQTLENIAQAIFKSWFVDFEPTRAKIAAKQEWDKKSLTAKNTQNMRAALGAGSGGNDTALSNEQEKAIFIERAAMAAISGKSLDELDQLDVQGCTNAAGAGSAGAASPEQLEQLKATAALFPDSLVDSELGEVPEGWEVKPLSKMVELIGGGTPKKSEEAYWNGDIPWFSVKDAPANGDVFVVSTELKITELGLNKSSTRLLPEGVTIISARGTVGRLALVGVPTAMNQSCYGVKGANGIGIYLNYFNLKEAVSTLQQNTHGAVFDTITRDTFETVFLVNSPKELKEIFEENVTSNFKKIRNNLFECESLEELRDSLLPKLLSGELQVGSEEAA